MPYSVHASKDQPYIPFNLNDGGIFHLWGLKNNVHSKYKKVLEAKLYKWIEIEFPQYMKYVETFKKILKN